MPIADGGNPLPNLRWKLFLNSPRAHPGDILDHDRRGRRERDDQPYEAGERESRQRNEFKQVSVSGIEVADRTKRDQKHCGRNASDNNQANIDSSMQTLA